MRGASGRSSPGRKSRPSDRDDPERPKEVVAHARARCSLVASWRHEQHAASLIGGQRREHRVQLLPVEIVLIRKIGPREQRHGFVDANEANGLRIRQRLDERRVHEGEDGDAGGEAERQRDDCRACEDGRFPQLTEREAAILPQVVEQIQSPHVATLLFPLLDPRRRSTSRGASLFGGQAGGQVCVDLAFDVVAQLVVELLLDAGRLQKRSQSKTDDRSAGALE